MIEFRYRAVGQNGEIVEGTLQANDRADAARQLHARDLTALRARPVAAGPLAHLGRLLEQPLTWTRRPSLDALSGLFRALATLLQAGVPLDDALRLNAEGDGRTAGIADRLLTGVREGLPLSAAVAARGEDLPALAAPLLKVGERTGDLAAALAGIADYIDRDRRLRDSLRSALAYPAFVALVSLLVLLFVLTAVLPQIADLFANTATPPPWGARIAFALAELAGGPGLLSLAAFLAAGLATGRLLRTRPAWQDRLDRLRLQLPVIGRLIALRESERLARLAAAMLQGGVALPQLLHLAAEGSGNRIVRTDLLAAAGRLREGHALADALQGPDWLTPVTRELIANGEKASRLAETFDALAQQQAEALDGAVRRLGQWLGPLAILLTGIIVGGLILSVMSALLSVNQLAA